MSAHLALRSGNPALGADTFTNRPPLPMVDGETMTIEGTVNKTALSLVVLFITAMFVWDRGTQGAIPTFWIMGGVFGGLIVALITVFKQI